MYVNAKGELITGIVLIGEIPQHTPLRIIKLSRRKQGDNPDRFIESVGVYLYCSMN